MSIDMIEFMLRNSCSADEVKLFISNFLNIPKEKILPESEFWEKILTDEVGYISLEVTNASKGFQTLVRCNLDIATDSIFFEKLALRLVMFFDSDVVVPDRRGKLSGPDRSLLYLKDGRCAEAIDIFMDGYNEVEITSYINNMSYDKGRGIVAEEKTGDLFSIDYAKQKMQEIIERVVIDDACKAKLIDSLHMREKIFPLKGILHEMQSCNKLPYLKEEIELLNDLTAIYI